MKMRCKTTDVILLANIDNMAVHVINKEVLRRIATTRKPNKLTIRMVEFL